MVGAACAAVPHGSSAFAEPSFLSYLETAPHIVRKFRVMEKDR